MTRQAILERTMRIISQLPKEKAQEVSDYADFISKRHEENLLTQGIQKLSEQSQSFDFLKSEDDIYSEADLKIKYNG
jgi:hypothetical protein